MQIDHAYFPQILDLILAVSDYATTIKFRATSTTLRDKIDKQLFEYVLLHTDRQDTPLLSTPYSPFRTLPAQLHEAQPPPQLALVHTLDIGSDLQNVPATWGRAFTGLERVRRRGGWHGLPVCLAGLSVPAVIDWLELTGAPPREPEPESLLCLNLPQAGATRHVMHVRFDYGVLENWAEEIRLTPRMEELRSCVLVFERVRPAVAVGSHSRWVHAPPLGTFSEWGQIATALLARGGQIELVGVETTPLGCWGLGYGAAAGDEVVDAVMEEFGGVIGSLVWDAEDQEAKWDEVWGRVAFMERDEWRGESVLEESIPEVFYEGPSPGS